MRLTWILAALILGGCSASPDMAANGDTWKQYGYGQSIDGLYPISSEQFNALSGVNREAYKEGYNLGREEYCDIPPVLRQKYIDDNYGRICSQYQKL
ncbi:hypothetical protein BCU70_09500 [Vibrio sp. 10N.286.49.C2]|uniref:DUF2799 domain-containing protein n=1 Tax=unclassified Vibrio TaxID=2614977 RepID=UPI000C855944|nr:MULTISPECIES: DUF2799 domain-containing protein [unclassified Vibrio]PMH26387.1 hypothetical protein BCU70_09500 [Vibrio sp. 10N.286.49.C2]PMH54889.1 hypothetical protein BCU66_11435 [Vibrio sp. 10N.286.49.B1]PMH79583.1 hypothetical protein BCU58_00300 [Vibrio sp. 10N.286.48.B7]